MAKVGSHVKVEGLGDAITHELTIYSKEVNAKLDKAGSKAIKDLERRTKDTAPFNAKAYHRHYVDCITTKKETSRTGASKFIWYVKPPCHRLTHLLVKGHETRDGGRTRADPFLQNALNRVLPEYENAVKEAVKK
jgi:hypothetical protein